MNFPRGGFSRMNPAHRAAGWLLALVLLLAGCATPQTARLQASPPPEVPRRAELAATPFFAQEEFQCGPAALAMALGASGRAVRPEQLAPQVYVPARQGSLQVEMLAAARRHERLPVLIAPRIEALLAEIAAGNPVVVLQNLGLSWAPSWHYAVAIGYDLDAGELILRSGPIARQRMALATFEHTWRRAEFWGFVVLAPGHLPATASQAQVVQALIDFAKPASAAAALKAFEAAARRWPGNLALLIGLGNAAHAVGEREAALAAFTQAAERHPDAGPAHNNRATVLSELGRHEEARSAARRAIELGGPWRDIAESTLREIERAAATGGR